MALMAGYLLWMGAMWLFEPVKLPTTVLSDTNGVEDVHHCASVEPDVRADGLLRRACR